MLYQLLLPIDNNSVEINKILDTLKQVPPSFRIFSPKIAAMEISYQQPIEQILTEMVVDESVLKTIKLQIAELIEFYRNHK